MIFFFCLSLLLLVSFRLVLFFLDRSKSTITFGDSMGNLKYVKEYYRTNGSPMDVTGQYILDEADYPNGFHKIFYYLKISIPWLEKFGGLIPIFCDSLLLLLITLAIYAFGGEQYEWLLAFPFLRTFYGNVGRANHFSERAYGGLWGNAYLFSIVS